MNKELVLLNCEQGSTEWLLARLGIPTGTGFKNIVTHTGAKAGGFNTYLAELTAEHFEGLSDNGSFKSEFMERGNVLEPKARSFYELITNNKVIEVGGVYLDESKQVMVSPDGLIPELNKGLEIKCPKMKTHIKYLLEGVLPTEYIMQVQSNLWVTGYDSWDFVSYCPEYTPSPIFMLTITPDKAIHRGLDKYVPEFLKALEMLKTKGVQSGIPVL